jgi:DNA-binding response OmpR family regulator
MASPRERILLVENDPDISDLIARQALKPLGYQVTVVEDAASAILQALQFSPDLIIANLNLSGLSGKDLLAALRAQGVETPLVVLAGRGQENAVIQAFRLGASDYLLWPARDAEVVAVVERVLRQTRNGRIRQQLDRQLKEANAELQRKVRELTTLLSLGKAVVSVTDQRRLFEQIVDAALQVAEADLGWLLLRDEKSGAFLMTAQRNLPEGWAKKMNQPVDDGISSLVALSGETLTIHGAPLEKFKVAALGKSAAVVPLKVQNEVIGLLIVVRKADREIEMATQNLLEAVADYASISLVNARLFRALEQAVEAARTSEKRLRDTLEKTREGILAETQAAIYPLTHVLNGASGSLNPEQQQALQTVFAALQRLTRLSEKTITRRGGE